MDTTKVLSLKKAADELGITDLDGLRKSARKYGALIVVGGGLEYVDTDRFNAGVEKDVNAKVEQAAKHKTVKRVVGAQMGIVNARLAQADDRISKKQAKIDTATKALAKAPNRYTKVKTEAEIAKLRGELDNLVTGKARDEKLLNELLNGYEPESDSQ
jgi:hypothetical protein